MKLQIFSDQGPTNNFFVKKIQKEVALKILNEMFETLDVAENPASFQLLPSVPVIDLSPKEPDKTSNILLFFSLSEVKLEQLTKSPQETLDQFTRICISFVYNYSRGVVYKIQVVCEISFADCNMRSDLKLRPPQMI